jgi:peptide chain release factor
MKYLLQISSGRGPAECCWVAARLAEMIVFEANKNGLSPQIIETEPGPEADTYKSALLSIEGAGARLFASQWIGTVQWTGQSMFRPKHKRKNWFVGVNKVEHPDGKAIDLNDIKFERALASGPGGQHVNKTETAIRAVHKPTGTSAISSCERSQKLNRDLALQRLLQKLEDEKKIKIMDNQFKTWSNHNSLERGNPVRIF